MMLKLYRGNGKKAAHVKPVAAVNRIGVGWEANRTEETVLALALNVVLLAGYLKTGTISWH